MDSLRIILILIGLAVLAAIWLLHRPEGSRKPGAVRREGRRVEPGLEPGPPPADPDTESGIDPYDGRETEANAEREASDRQPRQTSLPDLERDDPEFEKPARSVSTSASASKPDRKPASGPRERVEPEIDPAQLRARATAQDAAAPKRSERREPEFEPDRGYEYDPAPKKDEVRKQPPPPDRTPPDAEWREPESVQREARAALLSEPEDPASEPPRIVTLYVRARGERLISGLSLLDAAIKAGLRFGEMKIFHRRHQGASKPVFSMANISRPGSFDPSGWNLFETPGVTLFMTLPGPVSALDAWDAMLATGKRLSELLEADLLDDSQCLVTRQRIAQIREDMREYDRKAGLLR